MDPVTLAAGAATLLATKAAEDFAGDAGSAAWRALRRLAGAIRERFAGDDEVQGALDSLEKKPDSDARERVVAEVLEDRVRNDPAFAAELDELVRDAQQATAVQITATDAGITAGGDVTQTAHGSGDAVGRDKITGTPPPR